MYSGRGCYGVSNKTNTQPLLSASSLIQMGIDCIKITKTIYKNTTNNFVIESKRTKKIMQRGLDTIIHSLFSYRMAFIYVLCGN